jgi:thymidylate synthase
MRVYHFSENNPKASYLMLMTDLLETTAFHTGEWQAMNTSRSSAHATHELEDVSLVWDQVPSYASVAIPAVDWDWAKEHFNERVAGVPVNPAPSHVRWPYAVRDNADHTTGEVFDHTYPERFWPKFANEGTTRPNGRQVFVPHNGIRFEYGDLDDVVNLLVRAPLTRQAYLPVWFPEDTGAVDGQRVPCTLGYHFMQRRGFLSCRYYIRSCDAYRHLSNDVFMAVALMNWICNAMADRTQDREMKLKVRPGSFAMHIASLHSFVGDHAKLKERLEVVSRAA